MAGVIKSFVLNQGSAGQLVTKGQVILTPKTLRDVSNGSVGYKCKVEKNKPIIPKTDEVQKLVVPTIEPKKKEEKPTTTKKKPAKRKRSKMGDD